MFLIEATGFDGPTGSPSATPAGPVRPGRQVPVTVHVTARRGLPASQGDPACTTSAALPVRLLTTGPIWQYKFPSLPMSGAETQK